MILPLEQQVTNSKSKRLRGGGYHAVHKWLFKHFGKANRCENLHCKGVSSRFHWAKIQGKRYEHRRENFKMLCASCHRIYDQQPDWIERARQKKIGKKLSSKWKRAIARSCIGINKGNKNASKTVVQSSLNGETLNTWKCMSEAARQLGISKSGITMACRGQIKSSGGYIWNYLNK